MPYWLEAFGRGETIVIPNIEGVKTQMPSEYEILKTQGIHSEIAVPVFYRGNLSGFFGLDNPQRAMTAGQLRLLAFVGGHLGSAGEPAHADAAGRKAEVARAEFAGREA